jgi:hypothetical protein
MRDAATRRGAEKTMRRNAAKSPFSALRGSEFRTARSMTDFLRKLTAMRELNSNNGVSRSKSRYRKAALKPNYPNRTMSPRSYNWHKAQVCMSLARATDDPSLKRTYESLALDFLERGDERRDTASRTESGTAAIGETGAAGDANRND